MAPTIDDLRSLLDERSGAGTRGPGSERTATARLAGVRGRVRRTRTRQAMVTAAAAVAIVAGAVNVLAPTAPRKEPPAAPTTSNSQVPPSPPAQDFQGRPLALTATVSTNGPRAVTYTVIPRRADLSFTGGCIGSPMVMHRVYINGEYSHGGPCGSYEGAWLTRNAAEWEEWSVAAGRPMTVEIVLAFETSEPSAPRRLQDAPQTTFIDALYGDVEVEAAPAPMATASPKPFLPGADQPVVARGVLTQNRRSLDVTTTQDLDDGYTLVVHCAGVTSHLMLRLLLDGDLLMSVGCGSKHQSTNGVDRSVGAIPRGSRLTAMLVDERTSHLGPVSGVLDPVAVAFELRRGVEGGP